MMPLGYTCAGGTRKAAREPTGRMKCQRKEGYGTVMLFMK